MNCYPKVFIMHNKIVLKIMLKIEKTIETFQSYTSILKKIIVCFNPFSFSRLIVAHKNIKIFSPNFKQRQEEAVSVIAS